MDKSIANAERTAVVLEAELAALIGGAAAGAEPPVTADPGLAKLRETYSKLQYQLTMLKRSTAAAGGGGGAPPAKKAKAKALITPVDPAKAMSYLVTLNEVFMVAIENAFPGVELDNATITRNSAKVQKPKKAKGKGKEKAAPAAPSEQASYQCCAAMGLLGKIKGTAMELKSPVMVAQAILKGLPSQPFIEKCEVGGPGFINIHIKKDYVNSLLTQILTTGVKPPPADRKKVTVDFSSPNIAKEMHVGHLRSTIIGECISRMLEFAGHDVSRINHIGDWGTQFGMLIANLKDKFPNYKTESPPIGDLQVFYKNSKKRFDDEEEFKARSYKEVEALQSGKDVHVTRAWQLIVNESRKQFVEIYDRLDVTLEEKGESFYQSRMVQLVKDLDAAGKLDEHPDTTKAGCKIMWTREQAEGVIPLIVVKSGGGFTYDTSDLATIRYRAHEQKSDWLIYVVDSGQSLHFELIFEAARNLGYVTPETRVDHVNFGVVLGEDGGRIKSRSGETITLKSLLDEGLMRAGQFRVLKGYGREHADEDVIAAALSADAPGAFGVTVGPKDGAPGVYITAIDGGAAAAYNANAKTKKTERISAGDRLVAVNEFDARSANQAATEAFLAASGKDVRFIVARPKSDAAADGGLKENAPTLNAEETRKADQAIAYSSIKYADLCQKRTGNYTFSYDKMLADKGNTATYCINAFARIQQVLNQPELQHIDLSKVTESSTVVLATPHPAEWKLAQHLVRFPDALRMAVRDLLPNGLCDYLHELSATVHEFYEQCYVIERKADGTSNVNEHRLYEYAAAAKVMEVCFELVGLRYVDKM